MKVYVSQINWREYKVYAKYFSIFPKYIGKATVSLKGKIKIDSKRKLRQRTIRKVMSAVKTYEICKGMK